MSRSWLKLSLLTSLYFAQGLPFGFFTQALPVIMRTQGLSLEKIGLSSLLALPWGLKFLWAPYVDRGGSERFGRRRSFIVPIQLASVALAAGLAFIDAHDLNLVFAAVFLVNLFAATQDIATDALAVDVLDERERGLGNGIQVAGYRVGMIVGGGAMLVLFDRAGWTDTFLAMGAALLFSTVPILLFREPPASVETTGAAARVEKASLRAFFSRKGIWEWLLLLFVFKLGESLANGMVRPFLVDRGVSMAEIGGILGTVGFTAGLLGALFGGYVCGRIGRRQALLLFGALQIVAVLLWALAALVPSRPMFWFASGAEHFFVGTATASLFTAMMDACRRDAAATDYTVQASVVVVATGLAATLSGFSAAHLGYAGHFLLGGGLAALGLGWAFRTAHFKPGGMPACLEDASWPSPSTPAPSTR